MRDSRASIVGCRTSAFAPSARRLLLMCETDELNWCAKEIWGHFGRFGDICTYDTFIVDDLGTFKGNLGHFLFGAIFDIGSFLILGNFWFWSFFILGHFLFCTYDTFIVDDLTIDMISCQEQLSTRDGTSRHKYLVWEHGIMLGIKGPKHSMMDKGLRAMTSQVQRLTKMTGMTVAA